MAVKTRNVVLASLLVLCVFILLFYLWNTAPKLLTSRLEEEQKIYQVIARKDDVLTDTTELGWFSMKEYGNSLTEGLAELEEETLNDYKQLNRQEYYIKDYLPADTSYILLSNAEIEKIYQDEWLVFNNKYPNARGIISFSRIGFNSSFSQALMLMGYGLPAEDEYSGGYSEGTFILLEKKQGIWTVIEELTAWIS